MKPTKSLCLFIQFHHNQHLPYYTSIYVNELSRFFDEVVLLTIFSDLILEEKLHRNVFIKSDENKGYDFGRFYNYLKTIDISDYHTIACVNDSNVLIRPLDEFFRWDRKSGFDLTALLDSYQNPDWVRSKDPYCLQSHFIVFHQHALYQLDNYFKSVDVDKIFHEKDLKILRHMVIRDWEMGVSKFMKEQGMTLGSFIQAEVVNKQFNQLISANAGLKIPFELVRLGYPVIKKKAIFQLRWLPFNSYFTWIALIKEFAILEYDKDKLIKELQWLKFQHRSKKIIKVLRSTFFSTKRSNH